MKPYRILVVDDDVSTRGLLQATLADYDLAEARDAEEALAVIGQFAPDIVVLDWRLPGRWGGEILGEPRRDSGARVLVLTAEEGAHTQLLAEGLGADAFLRKPFSPIELVREIERLLAWSTPRG